MLKTLGLDKAPLGFGRFSGKIKCGAFGSDRISQASVIVPAG
jgi:hypothetical protein